jgi:hypothetical protein
MSNIIPVTRFLLYALCNIFICNLGEMLLITLQRNKVNRAEKLCSRDETFRLKLRMRTKTASKIFLIHADTVFTGKHLAHLTKRC